MENCNQAQALNVVRATKFEPLFISEIQENVPNRQSECGGRQKKATEGGNIP
jgi:hypothetical protein